MVWLLALAPIVLAAQEASKSCTTRTNSGVMQTTCDDESWVKSRKIGNTIQHDTSSGASRRTRRIGNDDGLSTRSRTIGRVVQTGRSDGICGTTRRSGGTSSRQWNNGTSTTSRKVGRRTSATANGPVVKIFGRVRPLPGNDNQDQLEGESDGEDLRTSTMSTPHLRRMTG
jgi:hypothetical protein